MKTSITTNFTKFQSIIEDKEKSFKYAMIGCGIVVAVIIVLHLCGIGWSEKY